VKQGSAWALQPLPSALRYRLVRDRIRDYILDHRLRGGDPLPSEGDLSRRLRVSRNAVREGLRALEAHGIIEVRRGSGSFVREIVLDDLLASFTYSLFFDHDSVIELYHIRQKLEENFLPLALDTLSPDTLGELRRLLDRMRGCRTWGQEYMNFDMQLHRTIFSGVGNRTLLKLFDIFSIIYRQTNGILRKRSASGRRVDLAAHSALVAALERRDLRRALLALGRTWSGLPTLSLRARVETAPARPAGYPRHDTKGSVRKD
jgi:DNA-binding FadR family transcriptional regulator